MAIQGGKTIHFFLKFGSRSVIVYKVYLIHFWHGIAQKRCICVSKCIRYTLISPKNLSKWCIFRSKSVLNTLFSPNFSLGVYLCIKCIRYTFGIKLSQKGVFVYQSVSDTPPQSANFRRNLVNSVFFTPKVYSIHFYPKIQI